MNDDEKQMTGNQQNYIWRCILRAVLNICLLGILVVFWFGVYSNGLPGGVGGGKFLVFFHLAIIFGIYKINFKFKKLTKLK